MVWKRVWKSTFLVGSGFGEPGGTPHQEFSGVPPGVSGCKEWFKTPNRAKFALFGVHWFAVPKWLLKDTIKPTVLDSYNGTSYTSILTTCRKNSRLNARSVVTDILSSSSVQIPIFMINGDQWRIYKEKSLSKTWQKADYIFYPNLSRKLFQCSFE